MKGSLFPLFSLFWWPISIHPVKTWTTKIGEIGTLSIFSLGEVPKPWGGPYFPWEGPYFPYFQSLSFYLAKTWTTKIGEIGEIRTLSWFWHFTLRGNRGNRGPLNVFPWWNVKIMKGSLFPVFCRPMYIHPVKIWTTKIREIGEIGTLSWFRYFTLRENRGNKDPLSVFLRWSAKTMKRSLFPLFWWPIS